MAYVLAYLGENSTVYLSNCGLFESTEIFGFYGFQYFKRKARSHKRGHIIRKHDFQQGGATVEETEVVLLKWC